MGCISSKQSVSSPPQCELGDCSPGCVPATEVVKPNSQPVIGDSITDDLRIAGLILTGVLEGFIAQTFPSLVEITENVRSVVQHLQSAFSKFKHMSVHSVGRALHELAEALKCFVSGVGSAVYDAVQFGRAIAQLRSPVDVVYHVGKSLLLNGKEIYDLIVQMVAGWEACQWRGTGRSIGRVIARLTTFQESMATQAVLEEVDDELAPEDEIQGTTSEEINMSDADRSKTEMIMQGVVDGLSTSAARAVLTGTSGSRAALLHFERCAAQGKKKSFVAISDALHELGQAFAFVESAMIDAHMADDDVSRLRCAIDQVEAPDMLDFSISGGVDVRLSVNGRDIFGHVRRAIADYGSEQWGAFGRSLGCLAKDLVEHGSKDARRACGL